jgi:hypothetical protein
MEAKVWHLECHECGKAFTWSNRMGRPPSLCSDECRRERSRKRDRDKVKRVRIPRPTKCGHCGGQLPEPSGVGRPREFCSDACKVAARRQRQREGTTLARKCRFCGGEPKNRTGVPVCVECSERNKAQLSRRRTLAPYGITPEGYDSMLAEQDGRCAICRTLEPGRNFFVVDHDHDTGKVRGLLCVKCNSGLGMFDDDPVVLMHATQYLTRSPKAKAVWVDQGWRTPKS